MRRSLEHGHHDDRRREGWGAPIEHPESGGRVGGREHRHGPRSGWRGAYGIGPRGPFVPPQARLWLPVTISLVVQVVAVTVQLPGVSISQETAGLAYLFAVLGPEHQVRAEDIVARIGGVKTGPQGPFQSDVPVEPVVIEKATVISQ